MELTKNIQLAFYGDDFTGSTDAMEFLTRAGLRTVLFLENPSSEQMERFGNPEAIGIAGMTRAMIPNEMEQTLAKAFTELKKLNPRHVHYKVCSTFDSSPEIGNIGTAIETGQKIFKNDFTPVLVAAPHLGRYSAFGNLFARMGIGSQGKIFRLDRHPSMCAHPVTPATESDLQVHLGRQTQLPIGLIDLVDLQNEVDEIQQKIDVEVSAGKRILFFDGICDEQMAKIGAVIDRQVIEEQPLFSVGSSGIEKALGDYWADENRYQPRQSWTELKASGPMLVLSGSVSPVTADQITRAVESGFEEIAVDALIMDTDDPETFITEYQQKIISAFKKGQSVILHTSKGPDDPRVQQIKELLEGKGWDEQTRRIETSKRFGKILGQSARRALEEFQVKRMVIAGGDTSGYVARELGIEAVEMIAPVFPGAPVCKAFANASPVNGMEVNLKGGQVGDENYFIKIKKWKI
ncbi:four-carbon acid sugar kinase family protein [Maribellus mangrovi]|uniref:four-carbon acid sugar kinase family protein n=1 Tax=Maribellus mangrovi TaxID=3133146 RepID=UPI0030ECD65C